MQRLQQITAPTANPVTLDYVKNSIKVDTSTAIEDDLLDVYIKAATATVQDYTGRQLMLATFAEYFDEWCTRFIFFDKNPLLSIVSVEYMAEGDSTYTTLAASSYINDLRATPGALVISDFPTLEDHPEAVKITYKAGYVDDDDEAVQQAAVPPALVQAITLQAAHWYMYRTDYAKKELTPASISLATPYKIAWL